MLRHDEQRDDTLLVEARQQLVHLNCQKPLFRHRVQVTVEAVYNDDARARIVDSAHDSAGELARRYFCRVYLLDVDETLIHIITHVCANACGAGEIRLAYFVEDIDGGVVTSSRSSGGELRGQSRFAGSRLADDQVAGAPV